MKSGILGAALILCMMHLGCGGTSDSQPPPPMSQPPATPNTANTPPPAGGEAPQWAQVREDFVNDAVSPVDCQYPWHFTVSRSGVYSAGPCTVNDTAVRGNITAAELNELSRLADAVALSNLGAQPVCQDFGSIGSNSFDLTISPENTTYRIFEASPTGLCLRGDEDQTRSLTGFVHTLLQKYYPKRSTQ